MVSDARGLAQVERCPCDWFYPAGRNECVIRRCVASGRDLDLVLEDRSGARATEVPIRVVGEVHGGGLVRRRLVLDDEFVCVRQRVLDLAGEFARVAFLSVWARVREFDRGVVQAAALLRSPDHLVQATGSTTVQVIRIIVRRELVVLLVESKSTVGDPIRYAARRAPEVLVGCRLIPPDALEPEDDVLEVAITIRNVHLDERRAVVRQSGDHSVDVPQFEQADFGAVLRCSEGL